MPSNHISNEPYHQWLKEQSKKTRRVTGVKTEPKKGGGWVLTVEVDSDDDFPVVVRGLTDWINAYTGDRMV